MWLMSLDDIMEMLGESGVDALALEPREEYDSCIAGIGWRTASNPVLVYDRAKILEFLQTEMTEEDAIEHYEFNIVGSWVGDGTPIFVELRDDI